MQNAASGGGRTERFRALLEAHSLTVDDVAELLDRNVKTVYAWRAGTLYAIPTTHLRLLEALCERLPRKSGSAAA